MQAYRYTKA